VTVEYLRELRVQGATAEIARVKFGFPNEAHPDYDTIVNVPKPKISVGKADGQDLFPDIVVVRRPGQWLTMMAQVETNETLNDTTALKRWKPLAPLGELFIYVPAGSGNIAHKLIKKHKIAVGGVRTYRFRPVWGLDVADV
jgi:hypothetical protein